MRMNGRSIFLINSKTFFADTNGHIIYHFCLPIVQLARNFERSICIFTAQLYLFHKCSLLLDESKLDIKEIVMIFILKICGVLDIILLKPCSFVLFMYLYIRLFCKVEEKNVVFNFK